MLDYSTGISSRIFWREFVVKGDYVKIFWSDKSRIDIGYVEQDFPLVISYLSKNKKIHKIICLENDIGEYPYYCSETFEFFDLSLMDTELAKEKIAERKIKLL